MELRLDVYQPEWDGRYDNLARPAYILVHPGGNRDGNKSFPAIVQGARFFARRGFVAFSIGYRLSGEYGLYPGLRWLDFQAPTHP